MSESENISGLKGICENANCGVPLVGESVFDKFYKKRFCMSCYEKAFRVAEEHGVGDWFERNFEDNRAAYPESFWRKVGAFVDLSKCDPKSPYK